MEQVETIENNSKEVVINIQHVRKSFGRHEVLHDINMELQKGENLVVLGRSGEGKSVAVKCIIGLLEQDNGIINVLGKEVKTLDENSIKSMRVKVGFLFQGGALYDSMSVRENLTFPLIRVLNIRDNKEIDKRIQEMLENVGLKEAIDKMPSELSGGMRKRIALARTLILKPEIILYDEPTTGLDPITAKEISDLILNLHRKYKSSSLIITHDMSCARITADRILVLDKGIFVAAGTYDELEKSENELVRSFFK
jgi:phospholipid/cholesterol/gamma-HCH transport system ATP-binding protein